MTEFPDTFEVVCSRGHETEVVWSVPVDLQAGIMKADRREAVLIQDGEAADNAAQSVDRLSATEIRCPSCGNQVRLSVEKLTRLVGAWCAASPGDPTIEIDRVRVLTRQGT